MATTWVGTTNGNWGSTTEKISYLVNTYNYYHQYDNYDLSSDLTLLGTYELEWVNTSGSKNDYWTGDWAESDSQASSYFDVDIASWYSHGKTYWSWSWETLTSELSEDFYFSVATQDSFTLYYVADLTDSDWYTLYSSCNNKTVSISFWTAAAAGGDTPGEDPGNTNPVPEPATFALLGIGILGIARVGRKHFS